MIELTEKPVDPATIYNRISRNDAGSVVIHFGVVKPVVKGKPTRGIQFSPDGDLEGEIRALEAEVRKKWDVKDALFIRRMGQLHIGDIILVAAVSASDRESAFGACRDAVERFKKLKCVYKKELFVE
ncbi:MAG: molybdenum cofactor biosynthesis protein MoaE [Thermodesulfobacteriota bacterium]|nr:molybdenum cofactor biosynthesis protein MoaE [Thermodesulfobacteriota bacterium]